MGFKLGLVTFLTAGSFLVIVLCNEAWDWTEPCIIDQPDCSQEMSMGTIECSILKNGSECVDIGDPVPWTDIPDKPRNFEAMWDIVTGITADNVTETHIMLNMSWTIDTFQNNPTGFDVSIMGLTNHDVYKYDYFQETQCVTFDLRGNDYQNVDYRHLTYYFDCFRPLSPYCEYQLVIRTLPITDETSNDVNPYSTQISHRFKVPSCGDPRISQTTECQVKPGDEAAYWQAAHLTPYSPNYNRIVAKFDIPPESYGIYEYKITVYKYDAFADSCSGYVSQVIVSQDDPDVLLYNETVDGHMYTFLEYLLEKDDFAGRNYCMKVLPLPDSACETDNTFYCMTTISGGFEVLDDPCESDPCGYHGNCTGFHDEDFYECDCEPGYIPYPTTYPTCLVDSCYWEPCGGDEMGVCIPVLNTTQYTCNCSKNAYAEDGTCKPDPCLSDPCGKHGNCSSWNSTYYWCNCTEGYYFEVTCKVDFCFDVTCGEFGECIRLEDSYFCNCSNGYAYMDDECTLVTDPVLIVVAVLGSLIAAALIVILAFCYWKKVTNPLIKVPRKSDRYSDSVEGIGNPRVLLLYSEDGDNHKNLVQSFAAFLDCQLQCVVRFDYWETNTVATSMTDWITEEMKHANKIVIIGSRGTQTLRQTGEDNGLFSYAVGLMKSAAVSGEKSLIPLNKYVNVYFDIPGYSEQQHIPEVSKVLAGKTFKLPDKMEHFYIHLRGLALGSPVGHRQVEGFSDMKNSKEGKNLYKSIADIQSHVSSNPQWFDQLQTSGDARLAVSLNNAPNVTYVNHPNGAVVMNGFPVSTGENHQANGKKPSMTADTNHNGSDVSYMNAGYHPSDANPVPKPRSKRRLSSRKVKIPELQTPVDGVQAESSTDPPKSNQIDTGYYSEDFSPTSERSNYWDQPPTQAPYNQTMCDVPEADATSVASSDSNGSFILSLNMQNSTSNAINSTSDYNSTHSGSTDPIVQQQEQGGVMLL